MLEHVRQRLLHDPVGRDVDPRGQRAPPSLDLKVDREARTAHPSGQRVDVIQARLGCEREILVLPQHAEQPPHLGQCLSSCPLDRQQRLACGLAALAEGHPLRACLDNHDRDAVRHDVMELTRDSRPLLRDREPRCLLVLPLKSVGSQLETVREPLSIPEEPAGEPDAGEERAHHDHVAGLRDEGGREPEPKAGKRAGALAVGGDGVDGDEDSEQRRLGRLRRVVQHRLGEPHAHNDRDHAERRAPAPC